MSYVDVEYKLLLVLTGIEALAYLVLAGWVVSRGGGSRWAALVAAGAALVGLTLGALALANAEVVVLDSTELFEALFFHRHSNTVVTVARTAGALLLVAGVIVSRRPPAREDGVPYGPPA